MNPNQKGLLIFAFFALIAGAIALVFHIPFDQAFDILGKILGAQK